MSRTHAKEVVTLPEAGVGGRGVAVLVPCYNEEPTVARVVARFRAELPGARVYVFDNNSTDRTAEEARRAGAEAFTERRRGAGLVAPSMFGPGAADFYRVGESGRTEPRE